MFITTPTTSADPLAIITATLFPHDAVARQAFCDALFWVVEDRLNNALAAQAESQRREQRVTTEAGAAEMGICKEHLLRLARRGEIKREQVPGTRRLYFRLGDLLDWRRDNTRADGSLKHTSRSSAPSTTRKQAA